MRTKLPLLAFAALVLALPAHEAGAAIKWTFTCSTNCNPDTYAYGNTRSTTTSGVTVTASAWANTVGSGNTALENAYLGLYSGGLGVTNRDRSNGDTGEGIDPEHAMDNEIRYDSIVFSFSQVIDLAQVQLGWYSTDSDITILRYAGSGNPITSPTGINDGTTTYPGLISEGWELIGHYSDLTTSVVDVNAANKTSSYWMIMAYNPSVGSDQGWTKGNDYVKLLSLWGDKPPSNGTPEPGSMALFATIVAAVALMRRRTRG